MNKAKSREIVELLKVVIPNPVCELNYTDSFTLLCAVMLSAQTTDKRVNEVTAILFKKYQGIQALMNADILDVANIIKPLGLASTKSKNLVALARILHEKYNDIVPNTLEELVKLPGVGRKTASVVLGLAFNIPAFPVDTHVYRVANRLGYTKITDDILECEFKLKKYINEEEWITAHHLFLLFGRYHCKAIKPLCDNCILKEYCSIKH